VVGVVALVPGSTAAPEELIESTRQRLAAFKVPRTLRIVHTVPRAPNGKADYASARKLFERAGAAEV
jgi:acyl-CoA synthetase (AMP-forming)/AMP-acid ligase II